MARSRHLSLRNLEVLRRVAECGSLRDASKTLGLSAATVTQAIDHLERDIGHGVKLIDRERGGAVLTEAGLMLVRLGGQLLDGEDAARIAIKELCTGTTYLRVAYQPSLARFASAALGLLLSKNPMLRVEAIEAVSREVRRKVERDDVEVGISYFLPESRLTLDIDEIVAQPLSFVGHRTNAVSGHDVVELSSLQDEPFALPWLRKETSPGALRIRATIEEYFTSHRFIPRRVIFQGSTISSVLNILRENPQAVSVLAILDVLTEGADLCTRPLRPEPPVQAIGVIRRKGTHLSRAAKEFVVEMKRLIHKAKEAMINSVASG
jgi:molybdate transport repressor ModE-like protein